MHILSGMLKIWYNTSMILNPKEQRIGFTGDIHGFHKNIIKYSNRPFKNTNEMNEVIRDRHNAIFDKDDIIFNIGDALLLRSDDSYTQAEDWIKTFNGKIMYLPGNHESNLNLIRKYWTVMPQLSEIKVLDEESEYGNQIIVLCHYALRVWNKSHYSSWHLFGHSHGSLTNDNGVNMQDYETSFSMDVGVDTNNYHPYTYEDVKEHMSKKIFIPLDHHTGQH